MTNKKLPVHMFGDQEQIYFIHQSKEAQPVLQGLCRFTYLRKQKR